MLRIFITLLVFIAINPIYVAQARVDILPHLLLIEGRNRSTEVTVLNLSDHKNEFKLKTIHYRQDEEGLYTTLDNPLSELFDPDKIARISPKNFILDPLGRQKVRIALRKPSDLPEGEYRFHLVATGYKVKNDQTGVSDAPVSVEINLGVAIPVIVRHGNLSAIGKLQDFELSTESGKPELKFKAIREGTASTLGRIDVSWASNGEDFKDIGFITNFNLFTEINERSGAVPLEVLPTGGGTVRVLYTDTESGKIYDEILFDL